MAAAFSSFLRTREFMLGIGVSLELAREMAKKNNVWEEAVLASVDFIYSSIGYKCSLHMFLLVKYTWHPVFSENRAANVTSR